MGLVPNHLDVTIDICHPDYLKKTLQSSLFGSDIHHKAYGKMGSIYERKREWGKALEAYMYARETSPDEQIRQKYEKKIKQMKELGALP